MLGIKYVFHFSLQLLRYAFFVSLNFDLVTIKRHAETCAGLHIYGLLLKSYFNQN
jgi:hypothetical protein